MLLSLLLLAALAFLLLRRMLGRDRQYLPLPPGPKGLPVIGNLRDISASKDVSWMKYWKWSRTYGDVFSLSVFRDLTIVLNSCKSVEDLLEKRSYNYSDRPGKWFSVSASWDFGVYRYSDNWRLHRRTFHQRFQPRVVPEYYGIQMTSASLLMERLAASPERFDEHVRCHAGTIILQIVYGYSIQPANDPYLRLVDGALEGAIGALNHGSFWVDYLPSLKYVPGEYLLL
ncbi:hypothetical protein PQX77_019180 [Marasmius sp. AFHP31]|nr:hypothetical protein PQX77_019180 [Marasmius sp. AFHP31]